MKFTKKIKEFILAYGRFVNSDDRTILSTLDDELDLSTIYNLEYCSASDGRKNIGRDFTSVGNDFKNATHQAKQKSKRWPNSNSKINSPEIKEEILY